MYTVMSFNYQPLQMRERYTRELKAFAVARDAIELRLLTLFMTIQKCN
jgi:hypothetical protein